jgi:ElaA protein
MTPHWILKKFDELSNAELYGILRLRSSVFVVEQQCIFEDIDERDQDCYHLFYPDREKILAYSRLFPPGKIYTECCISRVCTENKHRHLGLGRELMSVSLEHITELFPGSNVKIGAQLYLKKFYESFGFVQQGESYMEDGIEHIYMLRCSG